MKKSLTALLALCLLTAVHAANPLDFTPDFGQFFATAATQDGMEDAQKLFEAYIGPYANVFGATLTGGWYNTAKAHKPGGFDLTITANIGIVPVADRTYNVNDLGLKTLSVVDGDDEASTAPGPNNSGPQMAYNLGGYTGNAFKMPQGTGVPIFPSPMIQAGLGLFKDTEILGRYMPTMHFGSTDISMWGVGLKHGLKQWIPVIEKIPVVHLSVMGGYTQFNTQLNVNVTPAMIGAGDLGSYSDDTWDDQYLDVKVTSFTANLLASVNLPVVCFYGGLGFNSTSTNLEAKGNYPSLSSVGELTYVTDPLNLEMQNSDGSTTKPRLNIGMRLKFGIITLHGDFTRSNYSVISTGLGISFR